MGGMQGPISCGQSAQCLSRPPPAQTRALGCKNDENKHNITYNVIYMPVCILVLQLDHLDASLRSLRPIALDIFHLLGYVSLNTAALRKILKKYAKNVEPTKPQPGTHLSPYP